MNLPTALFITVYFLVLSVPIYLLFLADIEADGLHGMLSRFLVNVIPDTFTSIVRFCVGPYVFSYMERFYRWACHERNPIMQISYVLLINGAFIAWLFTGAQQLPTYYATELHGYIAWVLVILAQYTYYLACSQPPGQITQANVGCFAHEPFDGLMYVPGSFCSSCNVAKVIYIHITQIISFLKSLMLKHVMFFIFLFTASSVQALFYLQHVCPHF
jgi:hypothetical protein